MEVYDLYDVDTEIVVIVVEVGVDVLSVEQIFWPGCGFLVHGS